jgi:hypothetical protein
LSIIKRLVGFSNNSYKRIYNKTLKTKNFWSQWVSFFGFKQGLPQTRRVLINSYSKKINAYNLKGKSPQDLNQLKKVSCKKLKAKQKYNLYFQKKKAFVLDLPFKTSYTGRKKLAWLFFRFRRAKAKPKLKRKKRVKIMKYNLFYLNTNKKRYRKRRHSHSFSRRFFTNIWLVAFIFTKPFKFKKVWYTQLVTRRVLNFFCTNFW